MNTHVCMHTRKKKTLIAFCLCACVGVCGCKGMRALKFSGFGIFDSRILTHFPSIHRLFCFCPMASPLKHFLHRKGGSKKNVDFHQSLCCMNISNTQYDSSVPPDTKDRSLGEFRGGVSGGEISDCNVLCRHHLLTVSDMQTRAWSLCRDRGLAKPYPTMSEWVSARPATLLWKTISTSPGVCLHCWLYVWMERLGVPVDIPGIPGQQ